MIFASLFCLVLVFASHICGGLIEERILLRNSVRFVGAGAREPSSSFLIMHPGGGATTQQMMSTTSTMTTVDPLIVAEQAKNFYPSPHELSSLPSSSTSNSSPDFRYCAESHLCECSPRIVSCKRLEINSTEFNRLQKLGGSTQYVLQELTVYRSNLSLLEAFSFSELKSLQRLSLRFNSIRIIHPDALRGLFQLKMLDFRQNSLSYLPPDVFTDLVQLEELDLSENNINSLDANALRPLLRLRKLSLAANDFKTIYAMQNLPRLPSLESLNLADNGISEVTGETFSSMLPELRRLDLSGNRIQFASPHAFINMPHLESVDFYANLLSYLDPAAFQALRSLHELLLGENPLVCDCKLQPLRLFYTQMVSLNPDMMQDRPIQAPSVFSRAPATVPCETSHNCAPICASPFYLKGHSFFDLAPGELACTTTTTSTSTTTTNTPKPSLNNGYLALFSATGDAGIAGGSRMAVGGMLSAVKGSRVAGVDNSNSTPRLPFTSNVQSGGFDESLAIAIGIVTSVLLLTLLVVGTLCFRHYFYHQSARQRMHRGGVAKDLSVLSTGHLTGQSSSSSHNSDEAATSSSHSSSPGISNNQPSSQSNNAGLSQKHGLSLSVTSGLNSAANRFQAISGGVNFDAFGNHHAIITRQQTLPCANISSSRHATNSINSANVSLINDYASIFPGGSASFNPPPPLSSEAAYFISGDGKTTMLSSDNSHNNGLLLQTVIAASNHGSKLGHQAGSIVTLSSSNDLRTFNPNPNVPRSESLV